MTAEALAYTLAETPMCQQLALRWPEPVEALLASGVAEERANGSIHLTAKGLAVVRDRVDTKGVRVTWRAFSAGWLARGSAGAGLARWRDVVGRLA